MNHNEQATVRNNYWPLILAVVASWLLVVVLSAAIGLGFHIGWRMVG